MFASGRAQSADNVIKTQNDEWILCITNIDSSSLPAERAYTVNIITRALVERLGVIGNRTRISPEYAYYEEAAWANERSRAARNLAVKLDERSALIYRGEPNWRYRQNIARIDADIDRLRAILKEIEDNAPVINNEPVFKLTTANMNYTFPAAPRAGMEYRFCSDQRADAFLSGTISEFYGRYLLTIKLYTVYTRSYTWEDNIVFSPEDIDNAIDEITRRLIMVLSGNPPATVTIRTEPQEALVLINRSFAGRDGISVIEYPAGLLTIDVTAPDYESLTFEAEVSGGDIIEIDIKLNPVNFGNLEIIADTYGSIYLGALYAGEAPLTLGLSGGRMEYIEFVNPAMINIPVIYQTGYDLLSYQPLSFNTAINDSVRSIENDRRSYYWALGGTWITGISAWIAYNSLMNADYAVRYDFSQKGSYDPGFYNEYRNMTYVYYGSLVVAGAVTVYGVYRLVKYIINANKEAIPIMNTGRN